MPLTIQYLSLSGIDLNRKIKTFISDFTVNTSGPIWNRRSKYSPVVRIGCSIRLIGELPIFIAPIFIRNSYVSWQLALLSCFSCLVSLPYTIKLHIVKNVYRTSDKPTITYIVFPTIEQRDNFFIIR